MPKNIFGPGSLRKHQRTHSGLKEPYIIVTYPCDQCNFRKHIDLTHTDNNKKKKIKLSTRLHCDSCDKYFYKKEKLNEHRITMHKEDNMASLLNESFVDS